VVEDDGRGFDVEEHAAGVGLMSMRDRIGAVGGDVEVRSRLGGGTRVHAFVPNCWPPDISEPSADRLGRSGADRYT
jgi:glucose-6-phosphate-specific signal transduction histidine kinase